MKSMMRDCFLFLSMLLICQPVVYADVLTGGLIENICGEVVVKIYNKLGGPDIQVTNISASNGKVSQNCQNAKVGNNSYIRCEFDSGSAWGDVAGKIDVKSNDLEWRISFKVKAITGFPNCKKDKVNIDYYGPDALKKSYVSYTFEKANKKHSETNLNFTIKKK